MTEQLLTSIDDRWRTHFGGGCRSLAWSPGCRLLAVGADGRTLIDKPGRVTGPMAPDPVDAAWLGEHLVAIIDTVAGTVFAGSGRVAHRPVPGARCIGHAAGRTVVAGSGTVAVFGSIDATDPPHLVSTGVGHSHALQSTGSALWAVGGTGGLALVDTSLGCVDARLEMNGVRSIEWAPNIECLVAADLSGTLHLIDLCQPEHTVEFSDLLGPVRHLALSENGDLLVAADDKQLAWWRIGRSGHQTLIPAKGACTESPVTALAMNTERLVASGDAGGVVQLWSSRLTDYPVVSVALDSEIVEMRWAPCGRQLAVAAMSGEVALFDVTRGELV